MRMASNVMSNQGLASSLDSNQHADHICIVVKFNAHKSYVVETSVRDTVRGVKALVAERAGISTDSIRLVLAGQQLENDAILLSCGLGSHTTLHAFCWSSGESTGGQESYDKVRDLSVKTSSDLCKVSPGQDGNTESLEEGNPTVNEGVAPASSSRYHALRRAQGYNRFFVFCKLCDGIRPAKLRLVCKDCGNGAFLVDRGPANWDDISSTTSITGRCTSEHCNCIMPKFFLRCCESHGRDVEGTSVVLKHVNTNRRRVECIACRDVASHVLIFPCPSGHVTCLTCFRQYCSTCLNERRFTEHERHGYTLPCPAGCPDSHIEESHHFLLMGKEKYERYKNFGAEEYVLQNGGMLCPAPDCGMGLFPDDEDRRVQCGECQFESCRDCRREYHAGLCHDVENGISHGLTEMGITEEMAERACWDRQSLSLIEETTKCCPSCQTKTERSGGCMHMVCSRCSCEWCWICVKPWSRQCMAEHWFG